MWIFKDGSVSSMKKDRAGHTSRIARFGACVSTVVSEQCCNINVHAIRRAVLGIFPHNLLMRLTHFLLDRVGAKTTGWLRGRSRAGRITSIVGRGTMRRSSWLAHLTAIRLILYHQEMHQLHVQLWSLMTRWRLPTRLEAQIIPHCVFTRRSTMTELL